MIRPQQVPAAVGQNDGGIASAVQPHCVDQTLLAQMPKVAAAGIGLAPGVIAQVTRGHDLKRANGGQRAGLRAAQRVLAFARVVHNLSLASAWQVEVAHEYVARVTITRGLADRDRARASARHRDHAGRLLISPPENSGHGRGASA
jgi:hypothetical protein